MNYFNFTYFNQNQMEYIKLVNLLYSNDYYYFLIYYS